MRSLRIPSLAISLAMAASIAACNQQEAKTKEADYVDATATQYKGTRFIEENNQAPVQKPS